jgi:Protein of unknown function (DUF2959)
MTRFTSYARVTFVTALLGGAALVFAGGCASDSVEVKPPPPKPKSAQPNPPAGEPAAPGTSAAATPAAALAAADGLDSFRAELASGQRQIDKTLASLDQLTDPNQGDLRGAYDRYCDDLARLGEHAANVKSEADAMRASRDAYFAKWEAKASATDNPTIRASADARRERLREANQKIVSASADVRDAYQPFMKDLEDIKKFLATDLSKDGVAYVNNAAKKVRADGPVVKEKISTLIRTLDTVEGDVKANP